MPVATKSIELISDKYKARFHSKVSHPDANGCMEWKAGRNIKGYGMFSVRYNNYAAHRIAWFLVHGQIPSGMIVCHKCDNPSCCNPEHLFLGTFLDNNRDRAVKGRSYIPPPGERSDQMKIAAARGENNGAAKLTQNDITRIRSLKGSLSQSKIALMFKVNQSCISRILSNKRWLTSADYSDSVSEYSPQSLTVLPSP